MDREKGFSPNDFVAGVPSDRPIPAPADPRGGAADASGTAGGAAPAAGSGTGSGGRGRGAAAAPAGRPDSSAPRWSCEKWCTPSSRGRSGRCWIGRAATATSGHCSTVFRRRSRRSDLPWRPTFLGGTNTTRRVELANGVVGYFKPFGGEDKRLESGFGQDSAEQSLHEAAAWRLASQMGPPCRFFLPSSCCAGRRPPPRRRRTRLSTGRPQSGRESTLCALKVRSGRTGCSAQADPAHPTWAERRPTDT
jgi:hypothetical protein